MELFGSGGVVISRRVRAFLVVVVMATASGCGSATSTSATDADAQSPATHRPHRAPSNVAPSGHSATIHLGVGRQSATFTLPEPDGVILLYRIRAPVGAHIQGTSQLPTTSAPLVIGTFPVGLPTQSCHVGGSRITCTVGEEWCPMPAGTWRLHLRKLAGPAGDVTVWFHVGRPPAQYAG
jgi:hypothetical protein